VTTQLLSKWFGSYTTCWDSILVLRRRGLFRNMWHVGVVTLESGGLGS